VAAAPRQLVLDSWSRKTGRSGASRAILDLSSDSRSVGMRRPMSYTRRIRPSFTTVPHLGDGSPLQFTSHAEENPIMA
jgi:hypothetical protein